MVPKCLKKGDTVALAAPARKTTPVEIAPTVRLFESWGLNVLVPDGLFDEDNQFAGSDLHRSELFQKLLDNPDVKAVFCVRGGYGTVRIVDRLDFSRFVRTPKWIVGYSDVTVLHSHLSRQCGTPSLHAIMPINIMDDEIETPSPATESLRRFLFEGRVEYTFSACGNTVGNRAGECRARIVGGNLSVLYSLLGSASDIGTDGCVLLLEDLDEYLYHIDRMMMALKRAGKFSRLKGLIVGGMTDMHDNSVPFGRSAEEIIRDAVNDYSFPVAYNCPFGHIGLQNLTLPLGLEASFTVTEKQVSIVV